MSLSVFTLGVASIAILLGIADADCVFNATKLPKTRKAPLILKPGVPYGINGFLYPDAEGNIRLKHHQQIVLACPGEGNVISAGQSTIESSCGTDDRIKNVADLEALTCTRNIFARAVQQTTSCGKGGKVAEVRLDISSKHPQKRGFVSVYFLCFEGDKKIASFARHAIQGAVNGMRYGTRPKFRQGGIVPDLDSHYRNSTRYLETYLNMNNYTKDNNLTRGHIVPRADFPYASQQDATFLYENVAPQWHTINSGNWAKIEAAVRRLALQRRNLRVVTGTWGVAQLLDVNWLRVNLYLNGNNQVPVPALFWKTIHDPPSKQAVAIFASNNPFISLSSTNVPHPCPTSVCRQLTRWLRFNPSNTVIGEVVCCEIKNVNTFLNITTLPPADSKLLD